MLFPVNPLTTSDEVNEYASPVVYVSTTICINTPGIFCTSHPNYTRYCMIYEELHYLFSLQSQELHNTTELDIAELFTLLTLI